MHRPPSEDPAMKYSLRKMLVCCLCWSGSFLLLPRDPSFAEEARIDFGRDIRPILSNNCFKCHGFDDKQRQAGLRLDTAEGGTAVLKSANRAVVAGKTDQSALIARITASDPAERMPPASSGKVLTPEQIVLLRRWVEQGAEWRP